MQSIFWFGFFFLRFIPWAKNKNSAKSQKRIYFSKIIIVTGAGKDLRKAECRKV